MIKQTDFRRQRHRNSTNYAAARPGIFCFRSRIKKAIRQMRTDKSDPAAVASPMGSRVEGNSFDIRYTPGIRTSVMAVMLWIKERMDLPQAQK